LTDFLFSGNARVVSARREPRDYLDIVLECREIAAHSAPGQFVMFKSWQGYDPILPRPFDIVEADKTRNTFRLIVKVVGRGTALMERLNPEDEVAVSGPMGKAITDFNFSSMVILARGCGAAAVLYFARQAAQKGIEIHTILSAVKKQKLVLERELRDISKTFLTATDDGSSGYKGLGTDVLADFLNNTTVDRVYSCGGGPFYYPYLADLHNTGKSPVYLFVENYMACGTGSCHGCAIKKRHGDDYYLVCRDGPLFLLDEVQEPCLIYQ
jgi:dihydroorotate dehydrogenase electron transfer subunit